MASWVTHLMIADGILPLISELSRHEFMVGNIAPDCNVENEDWTSFTPPREVTHWMIGKKKTFSDSDRFLHEYVETKDIADEHELSFLMGYYAHLITDAEFQRFTRYEARVKASWERIQNNPELSRRSAGMEITYESVKLLIPKEERMKDIGFIERTYLDRHPESGYFTDIVGLREFPDYLDYMPEGAIVRKVKVMGVLPRKEIGKYPFICLSEEEYADFVSETVKVAVEAIEKYLRRQFPRQS